MSQSFTVLKLLLGFCVAIMALTMDQQAVVVNEQFRPSVEFLNFIEGTSKVKKDEKFYLAVVGHHFACRLLARHVSVCLYMPEASWLMGSRMKLISWEPNQST